MLKANEYFSGSVRSIGFSEAQGPATIGVMERGDFEFTTTTIEIMTIISGFLDVQIDEFGGWEPCRPGSEFKVAAGKKFKLHVREDTAYLCRYR
jgi:purine/pyrimidine-nucleoside phosphorylase